MPKEEHIKILDHWLHQLLWGLSMKLPEVWTGELEEIGALGLHTLKLAAEKPDIILKEIREGLGIPHSTLTSVINRLENRGLLMRVISQRDRRSYGLEVTAEGLRVKETHDRMDRELAEMILEALDNDDQRQSFVEMLEKISRHIEK